MKSKQWHPARNRRGRYTFQQLGNATATFKRTTSLQLDLFVLSSKPSSDFLHQFGCKHSGPIFGPQADETVGSLQKAKFLDQGTLLCPDFALGSRWQIRNNKRSWPNLRGVTTRVVEIVGRLLIPGDFWGSFKPWQSGDKSLLASLPIYTPAPSPFHNTNKITGSS